MLHPRWGAVSGSMAGKGTAVVSVTEDLETSVLTTGLPHQCNPEYVNAVVTTTLKKIPLTKTLSLLTVSCHELKMAVRRSSPDVSESKLAPPTEPWAARPGAHGMGLGYRNFDKTAQVEALTLKGSIAQ
jgi:hypothetical protein